MSYKVRLSFCVGRCGRVVFPVKRFCGNEQTCGAAWKEFRKPTFPSYFVKCSRCSRLYNPREPAAEEREGFCSKKCLRKANRKAQRSQKKPPVTQTYKKPINNKTHKYYQSNDFLKSWEWAPLRFEVFKKFKRECMCCGATKEGGAILHVDHIKPRSTHPHLSLDIRNLQILCSVCNKGKSNIYHDDFRP